MSCCGKKGDAEERKQAEEIDKQIRKDKKQIHSQFKLLLLGAGESGKSTIAKQMRIIHLKGYNTNEERTKFKRLIFANIIENTKVLLEASEAFEKELDPKNMEAARTIFTIGDDEFSKMEVQGMSEELGAQIKDLWKDPAIQYSFGRSSDFQLGDSSKYFFENVDRIATKDYVPTKDDILRSRQKTTGITEIDFAVGTYNFKLIDVGGQRSERRKWIHCFEDVTAIIFCVALSEYDQKLYEDQNTNRMFESLKLFKDIVNARWFQDTPILLFLNKQDIFREKIKHVDLKVCFKDYTGGNSYEEASEFIEQQFKKQNQQSKHIYVHKTTATDTGNVEFVFQSVKDIIINNALRQIGVFSQN